MLFVESGERASRCGPGMTRDRGNQNPADPTVRPVRDASVPGLTTRAVRGRSQPRVGDQVVSVREPLNRRNLSDQHQAAVRTDARDGLEQLRRRVRVSLRPNPLIEGLDLRRQRIDELQMRRRQGPLLVGKPGPRFLAQPLRPSSVRSSPRPICSPC